jgi:predicted GNAT family acetyltransferase
MLVGPDADGKRCGTGQRRRPRRAQAGDGRIAPLRTGVPEAPSGRGVGSKLVRGTPDAARAEGPKVVPRRGLCAAHVARQPRMVGGSPRAAQPASPGRWPAARRRSSIGQRVPAPPIRGRSVQTARKGGPEVPEDVARMAQSVEFTRFVPKDKKGEQPPSRISVNVAHITSVVPHPDGGTLIRFVGSGDDEHVDEHYTAVMRSLKR